MSTRSIGCQLVAGVVVGSITLALWWAVVEVLGCP